MNGKLKAAVRVLRLIFLLTLACAWDTALAASDPEGAAERAVMLEVLDGDTAFLVEPRANRAWWIVGECRREIPLEPDQPLNSLMSRPVVEDVTLGSRQIRLRQQYRFDLASDPASLSVYSSVRSGWSPVPVKRIDACEAKADCRARMGLPEC